LRLSRQSLFMLFLFRSWWSQCDDELREWPNGSQCTLSLSVLLSLWMWIVAL
jgi:hypothetical protein